jgi:hypothetical protein
MFEPGSLRFFLPNLPSSGQTGEGFFVGGTEEASPFFRFEPLDALSLDK